MNLLSQVFEPMTNNLHISGITHLLPPFPTDKERKKSHIYLTRHFTAEKKCRIKNNRSDNTRIRVKERDQTLGRRETRVTQTAEGKKHNVPL